MQHTIIRGKPVASRVGYPRQRLADRIHLVAGITINLLGAGVLLAGGSGFVTINL